MPLSPDRSIDRTWFFSSKGAIFTQECERVFLNGGTVWLNNTAGENGGERHAGWYTIG